MKKAFTMIEFVFVIVVVGIISVVIYPKTTPNNLHESANQLISHIRYTQHLALMDDKFDPKNSDWYQTRWQLYFSKGVGTNDKWSYAIFSDQAGGSTGKPDDSEIAINPLNKSKKLTGGVASNFINTGDYAATKAMNLGEQYGILDIDLSSACTYYGSQRIIFDHYGRVLKGSSSGYVSAYPASNRIVSNQCVVKLCSIVECDDATLDQYINIYIEPETGYVHL